MNGRPVLLGGYAANNYDPTMVEPAYETPLELQQLLALGNVHEESVFALWLGTGVDVVDVRHLDGDKAAHIAATIGALTARHNVVLGGRLPDDIAGGDQIASMVQSASESG